MGVRVSVLDVGHVTLEKQRDEAPLADFFDIDSRRLIRTVIRNVVVARWWCEGGDSNPYTIAGVRT